MDGRTDGRLGVQVFGYIVSALFAVDLFSRLYLFQQQFRNYSAFWDDRMNILDAALVLVDLVTIALSVVYAASARQGGSVKSARSLRLIRAIRGFRSVRVLKMGRIFKMVSKNWNWIVYQVDQRMQSNVWKGFGMMMLIMLFMCFFGAIFFFLGATYVEEEDIISYEASVWEM